MFGLLAYDVLQPRILKAVQGISLKRYALAPGVDFCNHRGDATADVSFEYFKERFVVRSKEALESGEQVYISYGQRDNDKLLQYYGFVEDKNPNDVYVFGEEAEKLLSVPSSSLRIGVDGNFSPAARKAISQSLKGGDREIETVLKELCSAELDGFPTSIEEDEMLVRSNKISERMKLAIRYRLGKKRILSTAVTVSDSSTHR